MQIWQEIESLLGAELLNKLFVFASLLAFPLCVMGFAFWITRGDKAPRPSQKAATSSDGYYNSDVTAAMMLMHAASSTSSDSSSDSGSSSDSSSSSSD